ncbi:hypothetical protein [uncultured Methanocorpusculum sp.]|nr:hypothetical protein [uncultured Methanocorpusculum sp.]
MARKTEFDPLGGSLGGSQGGKKSKKSKKDNTLLGSKEHTGSSSIYDEVNYMPSFEGSTDALTASGESDKPKKKGLFAGVFGHKKSPKGAKPKSKTASKSKPAPETDFPIIQEPVLTDTEKDPYPIMDIEEDIFEDEPTINEPAVFTAEPAEEPVLPKTHTFHEEEPKKPTVRSHPNVCYLCGADSSIPHQQFRFRGESDSESAIPLCKTCMRAVKTLMKYRDPADEREIKSEWLVLAPGLDESRADEIISEGRRHY